MLSDYLNNIADRGDLKDEPKTLTAKEVVPILQARLNTVFGEEEGTIRVFESDGIVADAAAAPTTSRCAPTPCSTSATCARWRSTRAWCTSAPP